MTLLFFINFFGGLAMFLYALKIMNDNLQAVAGNKMKRILKRLTDTPLKGVGVGLAVTGIIQSSSATSVMVIGLVNAGLMTLAQAIGVIMGANIGTTVTAQLIAFNLGTYAYIFVIAGIVMLFLRTSKSMEKWSYIILGFGLLFVSLDVMSSSVVPIRNSPIAQDFLVNMSNNPILSVLVGAVFTMIIQSSSAAIGITLVLTSTGLISLEGAMYLIFGSNIGTTITAWFASVNVSKAAKQVALVHTLFNVLGAVIFAFLTYIGVYTRFIYLVTPIDTGNIARYVANAHTYFNIVNCLIFLPFTGLLAKLAQLIIKKDSFEEISSGDPKHLDQNLLTTPEIAIEQSIKEMQEMLRLSKNSLETSMELFNTSNYRDQEKIEKIENAIDHLQAEITLYLVALNERSNSKLIAEKIPSLLHAVNDVERIGDYAEHINEILNVQILGIKANFNDEFLGIISDMHKKVLFMLDLCVNFLEDFDKDLSDKIFELENRLNHQHKDLRNKLMEMIQNNDCEAMEGLHTIDYIDAVESLTGKIHNILVAGSHRFVYLPLERPKIERTLHSVK
ncbi:MAG: Na/Pi cotransporter family protein [Candidatus Cloacimonetes bacterium]|nr:Na/Pi cotransporter family protein [Candidatus Cloacimonadota bacterium]